MNNYFYNTLGDGDSGKSTASRTIAERMELHKRPRTKIIDADEKKAFWKFHSSVLQLPLRNVIDFQAVENYFDTGTEFIWLDNPGTARLFLADAIRDAGRLAKMGINIIPILAVGDRGSALDASIAYMELVAGVDKIFILNNPKKAIPDDKKKEFEALFLDPELKGPKNRIIIHIPPLEPTFATEFERCKFSIEEIVSGNVPSEESPILARRSTRIDFADWRDALFKALKPLTDDMERHLPALPEESAPPAEDGKKPAKAVK